MKALLIKNDYWCYVNGENKKPEPADSNKEAIENWVRNDSKATSDIILNISPPELKQIKNCSTSRDVWLKLQDIYQSKGPARKATLLKQLILQKMQEGEDIREHLRKFFDAVDKLNDMEVTINPDLLAILLIYSLPISFENFRCAIESRDQLPDPESLRIKIIEESDARNNSRAETPQNAMYSYNKHQKFKYRNRDKSANPHQASPCKNNTKEPFKFQCHKCRRFGHKASECRSKDYKKRDVNNVAKQVEEDLSLCAWIGSENVGMNTSYRWCLDSGATSHLSNEPKDFISLGTAHESELKLANYGSSKIVSAGTATFTSDVFGEVKKITLNDTLHVPELRTNLLSVSKMTDKGYQVLFQREKAKIIDPNGHVKLLADRVGNLFFVRELKPLPGASAYNSRHDTSLETWHRRLGHLNFKDLVESVKNGVIQGPNIVKTTENPTCDVCCKGKMTRAPFPKFSNRKSDFLEIIHTDVCGPIRTESNGKAKYFVVFIDDKSKWCEVRFIRSKDEVTEKTREVIALMENQKGKRVKCIQSDNGSEYVNKEYDKMLSERGIARRLTVPHNPQQNGVAERKNRTLMDMARCLLIESGLPPSFWAEAVNTANYLRNLCPSNGLHGKTPYELWKGNKPNINHLRIFGSKVYCLNRNPSRGKLEPRSREGRFIGYSDKCKGYRIWLSDEKKVEISRDVKFVEQLTNSCREVENDKILEVEDREVGKAPRETVIILNNPAEKNEEGDSQAGIQPAKEDKEKTSKGNKEIEETGASFRGPGRPTLLKTGRRGRPKKIYHMKGEEADNTEPDEFSMTCEIPMNRALSSPDADQWYQAMKREVRSIVKNDTWTIVDRPSNAVVIGSRMILRNKFKADGSFDKMKARLVAQGFTQEPGIHFNETFAPVARLSTIRLAVALAARDNMFMEQLDVTSAYLQGNLEETIYMEPPQQLRRLLEMLLEDSDASIREKSAAMLRNLSKENQVCLLKKALYGLKQAGRAWNKVLNKALTSIGAVPLTSDPCLYRMKDAKDLTLVIVYVDDILLISKSRETIKYIKNELAKNFEVKELGDVKSCLGMEFSKDGSKINLHQRGYISEILNRFEMTDCKPVSTPVDQHTKLTKPTEDHNQVEFTHLPYRELVGALTYLSVTTRPDLSFAVSYLGQFNNCYNRTHWTAAKRVLRYLKGTPDCGISYYSNQEPLKGYVDADWGNCGVDRRSYTGYVFLLGGGPVTWDSRKQKTVALSTTEAEYMALSEAVKEAIYLRRFLTESGYEDVANVNLHMDNASALKLAQNPTFHNRSKHIDIRFHFVRDALKEKKLTIHHVSSEDMLADVMTKGLPRAKHLSCIQGLKMSGICPARLEGACQVLHS